MLQFSLFIVFALSDLRRIAGNQIHYIIECKNCAKKKENMCKKNITEGEKREKGSRKKRRASTPLGVLAYEKENYI
jgi:hypothetical protein